MIHWDTINLYLKMWCITKINPASIYVHMAMTIIKLNLVTHMTHYTVTLNLKLTNTKAANDWHCCKAIIHFFPDWQSDTGWSGRYSTVLSFLAHSRTSLLVHCWFMPRSQDSIGTLDSWNECQSDTSLLVHWWFMPRSQDSRLELWILGMSVRESLTDK